MGQFDNYNYEINKRLPEYFKTDTFFTPIERFSAMLMRDSIQNFMEKMGVLQPFMVWKDLPEEYDWEYGFEDYDFRLASKEENKECNQTLNLSSNNHIVAQLPLTKRDVHAYIVIELSSVSFSDTTEYTPIQEIIIKNGEQTLKIKDINSKTTIEIYTDTNTVLINDSAPKAGQVEGSLEIIKRHPRDNISTITDPLDINEKCELEIYLPNGESTYCDLYVCLKHPVYVTEQNIRIFTLSAFPIEYVRLYGYMCHQYNNNHQWVYLWEKKYGYEDRIVYDKITKQYDCEIFYAEIKLYGLPAPVLIGFPVTNLQTAGGVFTANTTLDYWGDILKIPRRIYKTDISEENERYCFPKYYAYSLEQDYPYEQRLISEYKYNEDWQDYINIRDTEGTDIALVKCKNPYINNIYMYTESIPPVDILKSQAIFYPTCIKQINNNNEDLQQGVWENEGNLRYDSKSYSIVSLNRQDEENITNNSYKANVLSMEFDLSSLPKKCNIKGMQIKFKGVTNTHAGNITIDDRSFLKYTQKIKNSETGDHYWSDREIPLDTFFEHEWAADHASYTLGSENSIFSNEEGVDRDSITKGYLKGKLYQDNKIRIDIGFLNASDYLELIIKLFSINLVVYFDLLKEEISLDVDIPNKIIVYNNDNSSSIDLNMHFTNQGDIQELDFNSFIIIPPELSFVGEEGINKDETIIEFDIGNETTTNYVIGEAENNILHINESWDKTVQITARNKEGFKPGRYDIVFICGKQVKVEEVFVYDQDYVEGSM